MNTQTITWAILALVLVAFAYAVPPGVSPAVPTLPGFPDSNSGGTAQPLFITNLEPADGGTMNADVSTTFNATVTPANPVPTCTFNLTQPGTPPTLVETGSATVTTAGLIEYTYTVTATGQYTWSFTCTNTDFTNSTNATITVNPANALAFSNTMTDKTAYDVDEPVTFSATLDEQPDTCALYVGETGTSLVNATIIASDSLSYEKQFSTAGEYEFYFNCSLSAEYVKSPTVGFTVRESIAITSLLPAANKKQGYGSVLFFAETNIDPDACTLNIRDVSFPMEESGTNATRELVFNKADAGDSFWNVTCTAQGGSTTSATRKLTILSTPENTLDISLNDDTYLLGETITLTGKKLSSREDFIIELYLEGESYPEETDEKPTNSFGDLEYEFEIPFNFAEGEYFFYIENDNNASENGTLWLTMELPSSSIVLSSRLVSPGENITVKGYDFLSDLDVDLVIKKGTAQTYKKTLKVDEGEFEHEFVVEKTLGKFTIEVTQKTSGLEADDTFTVVPYNELKDVVFYLDQDNDGFGYLFGTKTAKVRPKGYVGNSDDCDDSRSNVRPGATEICDGLDNECNGIVDNGNLCSTGQVCSAGQCIVTQSNIPPVLSPPAPETPAPIPPPVVLVPNFQDPGKKGGLLWWILIPLLALILITGGFVGFVAYEGYLDTSSPGAFMEGVKKSLGIVDASSAVTPAVTVPQGDYDLLSKFITSKRQEGYDDLTIRNALIKKGWKEPEVDSVFDGLYQ